MGRKSVLEKSGPDSPSNSDLCKRELSTQNTESSSGSISDTRWRPAGEDSSCEGEAEEGEGVGGERGCNAVSFASTVPFVVDWL